MTSTCFIFPLVSQEILEGDIMSAKMSHPADKILWLIRVVLLGDTVQRKCWKFTVVQKGIEQFTFLPRYTGFEIRGSRTHNLVESLCLGDIGHMDYRNDYLSAFQYTTKEINNYRYRAAKIKCSKWLVSLLKKPVNSQSIAVVETEHNSAFPLMLIVPGRRLQRIVVCMQLKKAGVSNPSKILLYIVAY